MHRSSLILSLPFILSALLAADAHGQFSPPRAVPFDPFAEPTPSTPPPLPGGRRSAPAEASADSPYAGSFASEDPDLEALQLLPPDPAMNAANAEIEAAWQAALGNVLRQPPAILAAIKQRKNLPELKPPMPEKPEPETPMEQPANARPMEPMEEEEEAAQPLSPLAVHVVSGNWPDVKKLLASLPAEQKAPAYTTLLSLLAVDELGIMLPQDVVAVVDAAPVPFNDQRLAHLGGLVARSLSQSESPRELLAAFKSGKLKLAADPKQQAMAITKVLLTAGLHDEAKEYLPPLADEEGDAELLSLHARYHYLLGGQDNHARSWVLTQVVLATPDSDQLSELAAVQRAMALAPLLPAERTAPWLRELFQKDPELAWTLQAEISRRYEAGFRGQNPQQREYAIRLMRVAGGQMLQEFGDSLGDWRAVLDVYTRSWINEAQKSLYLGGVHRIVMENDDNNEPLRIPLVFEYAPGENWRKALDPDTAEHVLHLTGLLAIKVQEQETALALLKEIAPLNSEVAGQMAEELLRAASGIGMEEEYIDSFDSLGYHPAMRRHMLHGYRGSVSYGYGYGSATITTRAAQLRNLAKLTKTLAAIGETGAPLPKPATIVECFSHCHSPSEVYLASDIENVFGPLEKLDAEAVTALTETMRQNLAQQWRNPEVQQQTGTKRTPREQVEEIVRGYALVRKMLSAGLERTPEHVLERQLLASVYYDEAEFLYGQEVDLATYAELRDAAFKNFAIAAEQYGRDVNGIVADEYEIAPFHHWFLAALGASDLAYLTRQDEPDKTQVQKIAAAIGKLPPDAIDKHREMFAEGITNSLDQVPATLKQYVVRHALEVVGDHKSGEPLAKKLAFYDDLLKEVELRLAIDGSDRIGDKQPFGVHISLHGTRGVARENEAFRALLIPPGAPNMPPDMDSRRRLEQALRESFDEGFEVESLAFHPPQTNLRTDAREGWLSLPLGYAVLRAKDASVDRLHAVQLDFDFSDGDGLVRLPVMSQVVLLDRKDANPPPRPAREIKIRQLLDDRELGGGMVRLEISATAIGVVPELKEILAGGGNVAGFEVKDVSEQEIAVASLASESEVTAQTERRWLVELSPVATGSPRDFAFPAAADKSYEVAHQKFTEADVVDTGASTPLAWPVLARTGQWLWITLGLVAVVAAAAVAVIAVRRKTHGPTAPAYRCPEEMTPFAVIALLRKIEGDRSLALSATERTHLAETVQGLEDRFFRRGSPGNAADLEPVCRRWVARALA